jgi:hypothetical protein
MVFANLTCLDSLDSILDYALTKLGRDYQKKGWFLLGRPAPKIMFRNLVVPIVNGFAIAFDR